MINIKINNYNLEEASIVIVKELIKNKPGLSRVQYAKELGITERTFYRWISKYKLEVEKQSTRVSIERAVEVLQKAGYEIKLK